MKDYTLDLVGEEAYKEAVRRFILNYDIIEDKDGREYIVIYYANGNKKKIPNTLQNEKNILETMKNQVYEYKERLLRFKNEMSNGEEFDRKLLKTYLYALIISIFVMATGGIHFIFIASFFAIYSAVLTILEIKRQKENKAMIEDFDKNMLFLKNENFINKRLEENKEIVDTYKLKKFCDITCDNKIGLTISSIDNMSLEQLKQLIEFIKENNIDKESVSNEYKGKKLIKSKKM